MKFHWFHSVSNIILIKKYFWHSRPTQRIPLKTKKAGLSPTLPNPTRGSIQPMDNSAEDWSNYGRTIRPSRLCVAAAGDDKIADVTCCRSCRLSRRLTAVHSLHRLDACSHTARSVASKSLASVTSVSGSVWRQYMWKVKVKVNVDLYSKHISKALRYGTRSQGISQFYSLRSSANGMNHTCLCLPSRNWSFTDPRGMEGWVGLGWLVT